MNIGMVLEMTASAVPDRIAIGEQGTGISYQRLHDMAESGAAFIQGCGAGSVVFLGVNGPILPVLTFASARAGIPVVPLNYRLATDQILGLIEQLDAPLIVVDEAYRDAVTDAGTEVLTSTEFLEITAAERAAGLPGPVDDGTAIILFTSGTTSAPKGVVLKHQHLTSYLLNTVEFLSAAVDEATLISTPPYHIAGMGAVLSNVYSGRRMVHLPDFRPQDWLETVRRERITSAMVVPTMLARIVDHLGDRPAEAPTLASLVYGGARLAQPILERALDRFPTTGFVNAYGLTETSSTIAVLGPDDHRQAVDDPALRHRLTSVGRIVPGIEAQIRGESDQKALPPNEVGLLWVRGPQVSGEYMGRDSALDPAGWFPTGDRARIEDGFLYIEGRADDTIIRGGENIAPAEIEDELLLHPAIREVAVVGIPDDEWGERICAVLVLRDNRPVEPNEIRSWCRERLRGSRTPDEVVIVDDLPRTATGKLVRRELVADLTAAQG